MDPHQAAVAVDDETVAGLGEDELPRRGAVDAEKPGRGHRRHGGGNASGDRKQPGTAVSERRRRSRLRPLLWLLLAAAIVGAGVWYFPRPETQPKNAGRPQSGGAVPVGVAPAVKGDMPVILSQLGTVTPLATVTVKTQISGYLTEVAFQEGQMVKKGDFLAQIDPRPYQVALAQAACPVAVDGRRDVIVHPEGLLEPGMTWSWPSHARYA